MANMCPADGWFYVAKMGKPKLQYLWKVAVWVMEHNNRIVGHVSVRLPEGESYLLRVPAGGLYKHESELNRAERKAVKTGKAVANG